MKDSITGPAGRRGQLKVNAEVVNNNAVGEQSAITGKHGVALQVGGQTQLTGGEIRSQQGKVELGGSKVSQQDVSGQRYQGGGRVDVAATVGGPPPVRRNRALTATCRSSAAMPQRNRRTPKPACSAANNAPLLGNAPVKTGAFYSVLGVSSQSRSSSFAS